MWLKTKEFLKKYWAVLLLIVVVVVGFAWIRQQQADWAGLVDNLTDSHHAEIERINKAREEEARQHAEQLLRLKEEIAKIELEYSQAVEELQKEREKRQKEIVKKYGNDTEGLANLLADNFGLIVKPATP